MAVFNRCTVFLGMLIVLSWIGFVGVGLSEGCVFSVDSVWFSEETECDDRNVVEICYILSSDCPESTVYIFISGWNDSVGEIPISSVFDCEGDTGEVYPGEHCFYWEVDSDLVDIELGNVKITVSTADTSEGCTDTLIWEIADTIIGSLLPNQDLTTTPRSVIGVSDAAPSDNINLYEYDKCTGELTGEYHIPVPYSVPGQGLTYAFGYLWVCEHYNHIFKISYPSMTLEATYSLDLSGVSVSPYFEGLTHDDSLIYVISDGMGYGGYIFGFYPDSFSSPGVLSRIVTIDIPDCGVCNYEGMTMIDSIFYVTYAPSNEIWLINFDGEVIDTYLVPFTYPVGAAWDGCFFYVSFHYFDSVMVYGDGSWISPWLCPSVDSASAPVDTKPPRVDIICYGDSMISPGDSVIIEWNAEDLFLTDTSCSLYIFGYGCDYDTIIFLADSIFEWEFISDVSPCDSLAFVSVVRDSFCNRGADTCVVFPGCIPGVAELTCPPPGIYTACEYQPMIWHIQDGAGITLDLDRVYFSIIISHQSGDVDTIVLDGSSDFVNFECLDSSCSEVIATVEGIQFFSGDSVWVQVDSFFNVLGCGTFIDE